jgi:alpha-tubulin suppressor-like RCC1 family protein
MTDTVLPLQLTPGSIVDGYGALSGLTLTDISTGEGHTLVLANGFVFGWGYNAYAQIGNGNEIDQLVPVPVNTTGVLNGVTIRKISAGYTHSVVLSTSGNIYGWGSNNYGIKFDE